MIISYTNAPITTKVVCFSRLLKCSRSRYGKQCGPRSDRSIGAVSSWSTLFASILYTSVMLGNYLQQTTSADEIFRCIFSWRFKDKYRSHSPDELNRTELNFLGSGNVTPRPVQFSCHQIWSKVARFTVYDM